jgi:hypothetical protein
VVGFCEHGGEPSGSIKKVSKVKYIPIYMEDVFLQNLAQHKNTEDIFCVAKVKVNLSL